MNTRLFQLGSASGHRQRPASFFLPSAFLLLPFLLPACNRNDSPAAGSSTQPAAPVEEIQRKVTMTLGGQPFTLEVAANDADRQRGLMYRDAMPADHGMIFVFPDVAQRAFWMKNTRIPLDIVYVDELGKVVRVAQMKPFDESGVPSILPVKYAIELNVDTAKRLNITAGDVVRIPPEARETQE